MAAPKIRLALACLALGTASCAGVMNWLDRPFRSPGERLKDFPESVWNEYTCDEQELPFFEIERLELYPRRLKPGEQFGHRLVYVLCPERTTGVVTGELQTRILFRGTPIVHSADARYDLKPGRWVVDAFIELPPTAEMGVYALELQFASRSIQFERSLVFAVESADD